MNTDFLKTFMDRTDFPQEAAEAFLLAAEGLSASGQAEALEGAIEYFYENDFSIRETEPLVEDIAGEAGLSPYTVWELLFILAAERAREAYLERGVSEQVFYDTFCDLRYKALECKEVKGVWGTFVAFWYPIFYSCDIAKLGRLEYEDRVYGGPAYEGEGFALRPGDKVRSIHIPSSGEPFDRAARLDSYRRAYEFYKEELNGGPLVCICHSWLLYPAYREILPADSNVVSFMDDFHLLEVHDGERFEDDWRVFGAAAEGPVEDWPEDTRMRRAFKEHFLKGGKAGSALGVLAFDGEKLL